MENNPKKEKQVSMTNQKLSAKTCLGYGTASIADALTYNFVLMFFLFFLTNVAGINPAFAGTIALIATLWDAFTNPIIGQLSDNAVSKYGRRRPFLLIASIPLAITIILMFSNFQISGAIQAVYYVVITIVFWTSYTMFYIPYTSLGAELTSDYDERTKLRMPATIFNYIGNILGISAPLFIVTILMNKGLEMGEAWNKVAIVVAIVAFVSIIITWFATKGKELQISKADIQEARKENLFKVFLKIIKLKPYKYLMMICLLFIFAYTILNADMLYFVQYKMGLGEADMSKVTLIFIIVGMIMVPCVAFLGTKLGKKTAVLFCFGFSAVFMILFKVIGIQSFGVLVLYMIIFGIANCAYWQLIPAIIYDMCEIYEYKYGERREGAVTALCIFAVKVGSALALQTLGIILSLNGYDAGATTQSSQAIVGIENAFTIIPGAILLVAVAVLVVFPVTKKSYNLLLSALEEKRKGNAPNEEGLERLI